MSGVLAVVSLDGRPVPEDLARRQLAAIRHRGAGEPALWLEPGVALGQAHRATTPEAEREVLPLVDATGRYHLVWDGRIDNRDELARALGWSPERAREATDADYVLEAYVRWGDTCVTRLLGDWAIVIWDSVAHRLFAAKDPMGFRSLYYAQHDGLFVIGSEPLQVLDPSWLPPRPDYEYARRLLGWALPVRGATCYLGLNDLWGGQSVAVQDRRVALDTFWSGPRVRNLGRRRPEEYVEEFEELFDQSVRARVRSTKPIGVYFSGGLDSSYVLAVAAKHAPVIAVSTYAEGTGWDERNYQREVVEHLGVPWRAIEVGDYLPLGDHQPLEQFDIAAMPPQGPMWHAQAADAAAAGVQVVLGGEGGDEWLTGQDEPALSALLGRKWGLAARLARTSGKGSVPTVLLKEAFLGLVPMPAQRAARRIAGRWVTPPFLNLVDAPSGWETTDPPVVWRRSAIAELTWRIVHVGKDHLGWRDRWVLAPRQLEGRSPFYSLPLVEYLVSVPDWAMRLDGFPKYPLRQAERSVLPSLIWSRPDKATWNDLLRGGLVAHPRQVERALASLRSVSRTSIEHASDEIERVVAGERASPVIAWLPIGVGAWLRNLSVLQFEPVLARAGTNQTSIEGRKHAKVL